MMSDEFETTENPWQQHKFLLYRMLSLLWIFPSLGAIFILLAKLPLRTWRETLSSPQFEDLIAAMVIASHLLMILKASHYHRLNRQRERDSLPTD